MRQTCSGPRAEEPGPLDLEFSASSATISGGSTLVGGKGTIVGTFIGLLFAAMRNDGLVAVNPTPNRLSAVS